MNCRILLLILVGGVKVVLRKWLMVAVSVLLTVGLLVGIAAANETTVSLGEVQGVSLRTATTAERILAEAVALRSIELKASVEALPDDLAADVNGRYTLIIGEDTWVYFPILGAEKGSHIGLKIDKMSVAGSQVVYSKTVGTASEAAFIRDGITVLSAVMEEGRFKSGSLLIGDETIDLTGRTVEEVGALTHGDGFWPCLNNCLASQGINWAIVAILGIVCGLACATVVLCIECIAAAAGATTGTVGYCVYHCW